MHELLGMIDRVLAVTANDSQVPIDTTPGYTPPLSMDDRERMHGENLTLIKNYVITLFRERFSDLGFVYRRLPNGVQLKGTDGIHTGVILTIMPGPPTQVLLHHFIRLYYTDMDHVRGIATGVRQPLEPDRRELIDIGGMYDNFWTDTMVTFYGPGVFHEREYASIDEVMKAVKDGLHMSE